MEVVARYIEFAVPNFQVTRGVKGRWELFQKRRP
jgi:hypothetical protein